MKWSLFMAPRIYKYIFICIFIKVWPRDKERSIKLEKFRNLGLKLVSFQVDGSVMHKTTTVSLIGDRFCKDLPSFQSELS